MSKERLEEIKQDVKMTRKDLAVSPSNEMTLHMDIMLNSMDYLIEQAERVQELEEDCEYLSHHYGLEAEQNKRYREAIEDIGNVWRLTDSYQEYMGAIHDIIKDLEGEE